MRLLPILVMLVFLAFAGSSAAEEKSASLQTPVSQESRPPIPDIEVFVREGCPHCEKAEAFLKVLSLEHPELRINIRDVSKDKGALERLQEIVKSHGLPRLSVPTFNLNGHVIIGFSEKAKTGDLIQAELAERRRQSQTEPEDSESCTAESSQSCEKVPPEIFKLTVWGQTITLDQVGLPLFTVTMGLLDGFNPCSMWVLILMISLLAPIRNRWRMIAVAGTFIAVEGIAYFVFMAAWLNLFLLVGLSRLSEITIAAIALAAGGVNLKDYLIYGQGVSLSIPASAKPGIYARMRAIMQAENLIGAIIGAVVLAVLVQIVEFLCTSGFPALYTRILTMRQLSTISYYGYLLLYNAAYMLDDVIVLGIGVITLSQRRLQEKEGRLLKLISGAVMAGLGIYLLI